MRSADVHLRVLLIYRRPITTVRGRKGMEVNMSLCETSVECHNL